MKWWVIEWWALKINKLWLWFIVVINFHCHIIQINDWLYIIVSSYLQQQTKLFRMVSPFYKITINYLSKITLGSIARISSPLREPDIPVSLNTLSCSLATAGDSTVLSHGRVVDEPVLFWLRSNFNCLDYQPMIGTTHTRVHRRRIIMAKKAKAPSFLAK